MLGFVSAAAAWACARVVTTSSRHTVSTSRIAALVIVILLFPFFHSRTLPPWLNPFVALPDPGCGAQGNRQKLISRLMWKIGPFAPTGMGYAVYPTGDPLT